MTAEQKFNGVDLGWMQAQWRDCADKAKQIDIFRDMTGRKATVQQILEAVGEPDYMGPEVSKRDYRRWTTEEEETVARMLAENRSAREIADAVGRSEKKVQFKIARIRKEMRAKGKTAPEPVEIVGDLDPEGVPVPPEVSSATFDGLEQVRQELEALISEEQSLRAQLKEVGDRIARYRESLSKLLAMAGGGLA